MIWMGNAERELGRPADALPKHQAALAATRAAFGNDNYNVAYALLGLAMDHAALGQLDLALVEATEARDIFERQHGAAHLYTKEAAGLLAELSRPAEVQASDGWFARNVCYSFALEFISSLAYICSL